MAFVRRLRTAREVPVAKVEKSFVFKAAFLLMVVQVLSRVLGYARDVVLMNTFGQSYMTDAFNVAFTIPDVIYNVLIGDMSLVGPRPERQYYIEQITERVPYYPLLLGIKPGITSWGQVKFGYAENVDEMIERLRWDILYIENMSIEMDIKILIYTVMIVLKKEGK